MLLMLCIGTLNARAQSTSSHAVTIQINPISVIAVSGDPVPLYTDKASELDRESVQDATTFYNLTTNVEDVYISAELDFPMPEGTELWLSAESGLGRSNGDVQLSTSSSGVRIVSGLSRGFENGQILSYRFVSGEGVGYLPMQSRRVTIAIVDARNSRRQEVTQDVYFGSSVPVDLSELDVTN